jgi:uncharacterized protein
VDAEAVTPVPVRPVGRLVFRQTWAELTFVHWAIDPARAAPLLPPGVRPDTIDGRTYVGLVPFLMRNVTLRRLPALPYLGSFHETNVRLYTVDSAGRRGVTFLSLDASRLAPVLVARWSHHLPYVWSRMSYTRDGDQISYRCRRRWPAVTSRLDVRVGDPVQAGRLEHFLTARWGLHLLDRRGRTRYWPNSHPRWPLRTATVQRLDDELVAAAGFPELAELPPDSVLFSAGVDAVFGPHLPA